MTLKKVHWKAIEVLLKSNKVDFEARDEMGNTGFILACRQAGKEVLQLLIQSGKFDSEAKNNYGYTGLIVACEMGTSEAVEFLAHCYKVNIRSSHLFQIAKRINAHRRENSWATHPVRQIWFGSQKQLWKHWVNQGLWIFFIFRFMQLKIKPLLSDYY